MSANNYDWAQALGSSPGSQLAALQARQYESETTQRRVLPGCATVPAAGASEIFFPALPELAPRVATAR